MRSKLKASVQLTALPRESLWRLPFYTMDGEFNVEYLGCSTLSKATTSGLGSIQKPLREKYIEYRKNSKNKKQSRAAVIRVNRDGLTVLFPGSPPGEANQMFYDFPSINFFEAVRFVSGKGPDKKIAAGFLPVDQNRRLNNGAENLFSHLEKKHHGLLKLEHPVMLACVMRRTSGVRALDCHCFVTENDSQALRIVALVLGQNQQVFDREPSFQNRYGDYPGNRGGPQDPDILRNSYGQQGGMYRNEPPMGPGPGPGRYPPHADEYYSGSRRSDGWEEPGRRVSDEQSIEDRYLGDQRQYYGGNSREMGPPPHDIGHPARDMGPLPRDMGPPMRDMGPINPRPNRLSGEDRHFIHERQSSGDGNRYGDKSYHDQQRPDNNGYIHERQRSGEIVRGERHSIEYGHGAQERYSRGHTRDEGRAPRVMSPGRYREPPSTAPKPSRALSPGRRSPPSSRPTGLPRQPFEDPPSPRGPPRVEQHGPVYSASNLESRQLEEKKATKVKPVAKVPPNHLLGVKVLPTGLMAALPKKVEAEPSRFDDDEEDPYDNAMSREQFYNKDNRRNVKSDGDQWEKGRNEEYHKLGHGGYAPPDIVPRQDTDQKYDPNYGDVERKISRSRGGSNQNRLGDSGQNKPWSFDSEFQKFSSKHRSEDDDSDRGSHDYRKGENELSDMFSKMNAKGEGLQTSATNFEESLGYFP